MAYTSPVVVFDVLLFDENKLLLFVTSKFLFSIILIYITGVSRPIMMILAHFTKKVSK